MITAIIQARMGSTRLPEKVLMKVKGKTLLEYQIERIKKSNLIEQIIVATTNKEKDNPIAILCKKINISYFRGSEDDVLGRYYEAAQRFKSDIIVRITADCPLLDPQVVDETIDLFNTERVDYAANTVPPESSKYPDGSDVEVFSFNSLERAYNECVIPHDREHVTFHFWKYDNDYSIAQLENKYDWSSYRFTVDYPEDFEVITFLIEEIVKRKISGNLSEIIQILDSNDNIKEKNSKYYFGIGWES